MNLIYHIISESDYHAAKEKGAFAPESLNDEGFIHCSFAEQVCCVADTFYSAQASLLLLEIDRRLTQCEVIDEDLYDLNERYPHIYGVLPMAAVVKIHRLEKAVSGKFSLPKSVAE